MMQCFFCILNLHHFSTMAALLKLKTDHSVFLKKQEKLLTRNQVQAVLTSSVTMTSGYRSSDRKLKMHQILKASSLLTVSLLRSRFLRLHSVQHILLKSCWSKFSVTCSREVGVQRRHGGNQTSLMMMMMMMACLYEKRELIFFFFFLLWTRRTYFAEFRAIKSKCSGSKSTI